MIGDLTRHIFGLVAADLAQLGLGAGDHLGVNVSGSHLASHGFVDDVRRLLGAIGSEGPQLVLEVTEREALPHDAQLRHNIQQLRELGVQWALDDFGTGKARCPTCRSCMRTFSRSIARSSAASAADR